MGHPGDLFPVYTVTIKEEVIFKEYNTLKREFGWINLIELFQLV